LSRVLGHEADVFLGAAGFLCLLAVAIHVAIGGREIARPLLDDENMPRVARRTAYFCWHLVTVLLVGMTAAFVWAAMDPTAWEAAALATVIAIAATALSLTLAIAGEGPASELPQWGLFLMIAGLGWFGLSGLQ